MMRTMWQTLVVTSMMVGSSVTVADEWGVLGRLQENLVDAEITLGQATGTAQQELAAGRLIEAELEWEDGEPAYELELLAGSKVMEVELHGVSGKVLETQEERVPLASWTFDEGPADQAPLGWNIRQTRPTKTLARWLVIADPSAPSQPNALALTKTDNYNGTFNLAIAGGTSFKDIDLRVRVKAVSGEEDQGGGPIWRCQDENNYYICRFNPLEGNYRVYKVVDGRRKQLKSIKVNTRPGKWYALRVVMEGTHITCFLDGKKSLEAKDDTLKDAGLVGLWTKADAVTSFDNLFVYAPTEGRDDEHEHDHDDGEDNK